MKVAIFAEVNEAQLNFLRNLAQENNITATFVVEETKVTKTPITGAMLSRIAQVLDKPVLELAYIANTKNIKTVEEALEHEDVPAKVKDILYEYL